MKYVPFVLILLFSFFIVGGKEEINIGFGNIKSLDAIFYLLMIMAGYAFVYLIFHMIKFNKDFEDFKKKNGYYETTRDPMMTEKIKQEKILYLRNEFIKEKSLQKPSSLEKTMKSILSIFFFLIVFYAIIDEIAGINIFQEFLKILNIN